MFKVEFMVEDKRLGEVLQLIAGKVVDLKQQPVANARVRNGHAVQIHAGGSLREALVAAVMKKFPEVNKTKRFSNDQAKAVIEDLGGSSNSISNIIHILKSEKKIKASGTRGVYVINYKESRT